MLLAVGVLLFLFVFLGIFAQLGIRSVHDRFTELVEIKEPRNAASHEMEIGIDDQREIDSKLNEQIRVKIRSNLVSAEQAAHRTADRTERRILALILGGVIVGAFSVYFITRSVVRPIDQLVSATDRVNRGDPVQRVDIRSGDEFEILASHFNQMVAERERLDKMKSDFMFMVTHELNSPIAVAAGAVDLLKGTIDAPNEKQAKYLGMIHRSAARLQHLTADLVDLMKLEGGRFSLRPQLTDIHEPVRSACQSLAPTAEERGIRLQYPSVDAAPGIVLNIDSDRMEQVITNLVRNAIRFAASKVEVRVVDEERECLIWVEDDGPGVDENDLPKLFDKFYRGKQMPDQNKSGSGLGLSIVKGIVESHGGTVQATDRGGRPGANFVVRLPKHG